ncbi:MAG: WYL domain-containing protein [Clostridia bacterium]|nr:WYL domain-containing protein [Clostridia bacterium]
MSKLEPKKLSILRILQILEKYSDYDHPLKQEDIADHLENNYGIILERKAIGRSIASLKDAGFDIESDHRGSYISERQFEPSELRLLIDSILCSRHISPRHSTDLINKLCGLANQHFRSHVKNIHTVQDWNKTENQALFYNIEMVDAAIEEGKQLQYDYNKYGIDKKLHKSSFQRVTPYQLILHNQKYYLMGHSAYWDHMVFHRLDYISNIEIYNMPAKPIREIPGYEYGIDFKKLSSALPYLYTDKPERIQMIVDVNMIDHVIDWFGKDVIIGKTTDAQKATVSLIASPNAMEHWALQYLNYVEVTQPASLRERIKNSLEKATKVYQ